MKSFVSVLGTVVTFAVAGLPIPSVAEAQSGPPTGGYPGRGRSGEPSGSQERDRSSTAQREQLERRFQERLYSIVKQQLNLSDETLGRLREVASRTEESRRELRREEFTVRMALRREMMRGEKASETKVGELLNQMPKFERRRLELMEQEQSELSKFLTAIQRVRYIGLQEELRRGMQEMQGRRMDQSGPPRHTPGDSAAAAARRRFDPI